MKFQKKKITEEVRGVLGKYLDGTEKEFRKATERIVNIIQHINYDNTKISKLDDAKNIRRF